MKKASLLLVMIATLLFNNSYAQVTTKGGTESKTEKKDEPRSGDKSDKKEKVQSEMSGDAAGTAKDWTTKMDEICNLDASQEQKVLAINLRYANKLEDLKTKYKGMENPNADAAKAEKDEMTKQRFKEYSQVLSKDQMQKFKDYRNDKKDDADHAGNNSDKKDDVKEKYKNATPEEQAKMKEELKEKKEKKSAEIGRAHV